MTSLAVNKNFVVVVRDLYIDILNRDTHNLITIPKCSKQENDSIMDVDISPNDKYLAAATSISKRLILFELHLTEKRKTFSLPRSVSKVRFTKDSKHILVADKSGDILIFDCDQNEDRGTKLSGHLSLLLDVLQTDDQRFIITADRDEKIKVLCYPNTYNINSYCLGHREFVNHLELLPHDGKYLTSTSGDGTFKCWDYARGALCYTIDVNKDVSIDQIKENFIKRMKEDGIEVKNLPIVHYTATKVSNSCSLLAITVHSMNAVFVYKLYMENFIFNHKLEKTIDLKFFPESIKFQEKYLYIYHYPECHIFEISDGEPISVEFKKIETMFMNTVFHDNACNNDNIKVLYKRKFDNVQEYQERKKQRLKLSA